MEEESSLTLVGPAWPAGWKSLSQRHHSGRAYILESLFYSGRLELRYKNFGLKLKNCILVRKCTGVNWSNGVIFRSCTGWYKGNVANKSHGLSIWVTRVNCLYFGSLCLRFELRSQVYCCHWFEVNKYWGLQNAFAIAIAKFDWKSPGNSKNLKKTNWMMTPHVTSIISVVFSVFGP